MKQSATSQHHTRTARKIAPQREPLFFSLEDGGIPPTLSEPELRPAQEPLRRTIQAWVRALSTYIERLSAARSVDSETTLLIAHALLRRGIAHCMLEEWQPALSDCSQVIAMNVGEPETNTATLFRARAYEALEMETCALQDWTMILEAIEHASPTPERFSPLLAAQAYVSRARLLARAETYPEALADCERALTFEATCAEAYSVRGTILHCLGENEQALIDCTRAIDLAGWPAHYYRRGLVYKHLGQYEQAYLDVEQAHRREPENPLYQQEYAILLMLRLMRGTLGEES